MDDNKEREFLDAVHDIRFDTASAVQLLFELKDTLKLCHLELALLEPDGKAMTDCVDAMCKIDTLLFKMKI